jgi:hypothetical protein
VIAVAPWVYDDGGRAAAGYIGAAGDCVARAIAIATETPYAAVYAALAARNAETGAKRSAREGVPRKVYETYLIEHGFEWVPCMGIGTGCRVHLRADELPGGRIVARLSGHLVAVVDGTVHDTHDSTRDGTRCVYGYFARS